MWKKILKWFHPEGIPWPLCYVYNAASRSGIFQHYELVAQDIRRNGPSEAILDIGTGPAWLLLALRKSFPDAALIGVDVSPAMVAVAERNLLRTGQQDSIEVKVSRAEKIPYPDGAFDCVVSTGSIHHWKNAGTGLNEIHRVLKNEGRAYIYDLVRRLPKDIALDVRKEFGFFRYSLLWFHSFEEPFLEPDEMLSLAKNTLFQQGKIRYVGALCCMDLKKQI